MISERLRRPVKDGAITMALRRYRPPITKKNAQQLRDIFRQLGDITLRSNLTDITFQNSKTLTLNHSKLLAEINADRQVFYAFTRGVFESNIIISSSKLEQLQHVFKNEIQIGIQDHLSAIFLEKIGLGIPLSPNFVQLISIAHRVLKLTEPSP